MSKTMAPNKLLVVEDDVKISSLITSNLNESGYAVHSCADGEAALSEIETGKYDLVVMDIMLPKKSGLEVLEEIRARGTATPVIMVSAKGSVSDRVEGLRRGADDYLPKPFSFLELQVRIQTVLKRSKQPVGSLETEMRFEDVRVNLIERAVWRGARRLELQSKEYDLLICFLQHRGQVLPKSYLLEKVWGYNFDTTTNVVDVLVCRLRAKLNQGFKRKLIRTARGLGYALDKS